MGVKQTPTGGSDRGEPVVSEFPLQTTQRQS